MKIYTADLSKIDYRDYCSKIHYGLTINGIKQWAKRHKQARENKDVVTMQWIENMLTNINFHYECGLFMDGEYKKAINNF